MQIPPVSQIRRMEAAVKLAEGKFMRQKGMRKLPSGWHAFSTSAPRNARYQATPPCVLLYKLDELTLPREYHLADLGSGLGMACFAASLYFDRVTGFELDPAVLAGAEKVKKELEINNVTFENQNFLKADLTRYNVLYIFHPLMEGFIMHTSQKMQELKPGTIVLANLIEFARRDIFDPFSFKLLDGQGQRASSSSALNCIYAFERR